MVSPKRTGVKSGVGETRYCLGGAAAGTLAKQVFWGMGE